MIFIPLTSRVDERRRGVWEISDERSTALRARIKNLDGPSTLRSSRMNFGTSFCLIMMNGVTIRGGVSIRSEMLSGCSDARGSVAMVAQWSVEGAE